MRQRPDDYGASGSHIESRKLILPEVRHQLAARAPLLAPGEGRTVQLPAGGELPLGSGRKLLTRSTRKGFRGLIGDMRHRMALATGVIAGRPRGCRQLAPAT
jgi:hypothetical protein